MIAIAAQMMLEIFKIEFTRGWHLYYLLRFLLLEVTG